jgi:hypothetical protein
MFGYQVAIILHWSFTMPFSLQAPELLAILFDIGKDYKLIIIISTW